MTAPATARRAVVLVGNPAAPYSRALRIGRALLAEGYAVEIAAVAGDGLPDEAREGQIVVRRYPPSGPWAALGRSGAGRPPRRAGVAGRLLRAPATVRRWLLWPHTVRGWWATLAGRLEPADLYHACGSLTVKAALDARRRHPRGPSGRPARVIYDAIDDVFESNNVLDMPAPIRAWHRRREAGWARSADAVTTVNAPLAARLAARWGIPPIVVVANYPEPAPARSAGDGPPDLIRAELGLGPGSAIVLFQGRLGPNLGLDEAAEAVLLVPDAVFVLLGFGRGFEASLARDQDPRFAGRHRTLAARHPDELLAWTASADVALIPLPPVSINQRLSSPNKFWEALVAGTPVVVPAGLELMAGFVREADLGVVAASTSAPDLAAAIRSILERPGAARDAWRVRIQATAAERFVWPVAEAAYRDLVRSIR